MYHHALATCCSAVRHSVVHFRYCVVTIHDMLKDGNRIAQADKGDGLHHKHAHNWDMLELHTYKLCHTCGRHTIDRTIWMIAKMLIHAESPKDVQLCV